MIYQTLISDTFLARGENIEPLLFYFLYRDLQPYRNQFATGLAYNCENKKLIITNNQVVKNNVSRGIKSLHPHFKIS